MLKNSIAVLLSTLLLFSAPLYSKEEKGTREQVTGLFKTIGDGGSVSNTYRNFCKRNGEKPFDGILPEWKKMCEVVKNSEICQNVPEEEKLQCNESDVEEDKLNMHSLSFLYNCGRGLWAAFMDLVDFIYEVGVYLFDGDIRAQRNEKFGEYWDSVKAYLAQEMARAKAQTDSNFEASKIVGGKVLSSAFSMIGKLIKEEYYNLGCYSQAARQKRVCKVLGDIVMPPAALIAAIKKGPGAVSKFVTLLKRYGAKRKSKGIKKSEIPKAPPLSDEKIAELFTNSKVKSKVQNLQESLKGIDQNVVGIDLNAPMPLIHLKLGDGTPLTFTKLKIEAKSKNIISKNANCHPASGILCQLSGADKIEASYINAEGVLETKIFTGDDALLLSYTERFVKNKKATMMEFPATFREYGIPKVDTLDLEQQKVMAKFLDGLTKQEKKALKEHSLDLKRLVSNHKDPYQLTAPFKKGGHTATDAGDFEEIIKLTKIKISPMSPAKKYKKISSWANNNDKALYLYNSLIKEGADKNSDLLRYLTNYNKNLKRARGVTGAETKGIITYSFEKESFNPEITLWYKDPKFTDEDWLKLPDEERLAILKKITKKQRYAHSAAEIAPTEFHPSSLRGFMEEANSSTSKEWGWEVSNKLYEFDLEHMFKQMDEVNEFAKSTHSIHAHAVFDIPKDYKRFKDFSLWSKHTNDYLYLRGMEEGLHGNELTNVAYFTRAFDKTPGINSGRKIPEKLSDVEYQSHKFFSMGIRAGLYGESPYKGMQKIGLELRDTTRDMEKLKGYMRHVSDSISEYRWEKFDSNDLPIKDITFLRPSDDLFSKTFKEVIPAKQFKLLEKADPNVSLPLQKFEEGRYLDYRTGKIKEGSLDPQKIQQIKEAREEYIVEMKKLSDNLEEMVAKGETFEPEDVEMAVRMTMSEWAKKAHISTLFEGY